MERVLFDVEEAGELVQHLGVTAGALEGASSRVADLLRRADRDGRSVARRVTETSAWAAAVQDDLAWRLEFLAQCRYGLPNVSFGTTPDGMREAWLPFSDEAEAGRWLVGSGLHDQLVAALDDADGATAEGVLDRLGEWAHDPLVLAGFASHLGTDGIAGLVARIDRARDRDPVDTWWEIWAGGVNRRWDQLHQQLSGIVGASGGLLDYRPDVHVPFMTSDGQLVTATMHDLLTLDPLELAGRWTQGQRLQEAAFVDLGGWILVPVGVDDVTTTPSGVLVPTPGVLDRLGNGFATGVAEVPGGLQEGLLQERPNGGRFSTHFVWDPEFTRNPFMGDITLPRTISGDLTVSRFGRSLGQLGRVDQVLDTVGFVGDVHGAWQEDGVGAASLQALDSGSRIALEAKGAAVGAAAGGTLCAPAGPVGVVGCGAAGAFIGGKVGGKVHDIGKGLIEFGAHQWGRLWS